MKRVKQLLFVLTLNIVWGSCWVSSANAGVITIGTRTTIGSNALWDNVSWDGLEFDAGGLFGSAGVTEYPSADGAPVAPAFDQSEYFWESVSNSAWTDSQDIWQLADASVSFAAQGYTYNTLTAPRRLQLFRSLRAMRKDRDDDIGQSPMPTPEPGTLALMLCGGLAAAVRKVRSRRS